MTFYSANLRTRQYGGTFRGLILNITYLLQIHCEFSPSTSFYCFDESRVRICYPEPIIAVGSAKIATATTATNAAITDPIGVKSTLNQQIIYRGNSPVNIRMVGNIACGMDWKYLASSGLPLSEK